MSLFTNKQDCCGCSACSQRCPRQCITMKEDEEGFYYPQINSELCINCGLCKKVCPNFNHTFFNENLHFYSAKNPSETILLNSSSGGVFTLLAEKIISLGGIVFGVKWDHDWSTVYSYADKADYLFEFRTAKYIQTKPSVSFIYIENLLKKGKYVLFSGLPCTIQGLKLFLNKEYPNLITVACVCHGIPTEKLWKKYLLELCNKKKKTVSDITKINLRNKKTGWKNYSCTVSFIDGSEECQFHDNNPWMRAFINNLTLRPSCHACPAKINVSQADISLGDLWGAKQLLEDEYIQDTGISLIIVHNGKGLLFCENSDISFLHEYNFTEVSKYNPALYLSSPLNPKRNLLFSNITDGKPFISSVHKLTKKNLILRIKYVLNSIKLTLKK